MLSRKERDELLTELMKMEELFEFSYPHSPSWASVQQAQTLKP